MQVINGIQDYLKKDNHTTVVVHLAEWDIKWCVGCEACITKDRCGVKDTTGELLEKMKECDALILATPVYMGNLGGKLKVLIDRSCRWFHRPPLLAKPSLIVATTAASGLKDTQSYLRKILVQWGTAPIGAITKTYRDQPYMLKDKEKSLLDRFSHFDIKKYRPTLADTMQYQVQRVLAEKIFEIDRAYWKEKAMDQQSYFYPCRIPLHKKLLSSSLYQLLSHKIKPIE